MSLTATCPSTDLMRGFTRDGDHLQCLFCGARFDTRVIHRDGEVFRLPEKAAEHHVATVHQGVFRGLLSLGKSVHGLSDTQVTVLQQLADGRADKDIAAALGGRSVSTVRNHRFQLRKKHREARVFVALMDALEAGVPQEQQFVYFHANLPTTDERTAITVAEDRKLAGKYFTSLDPLRLERIPKKEKHKLVVLRRVVDHIEVGRRYRERELNEVLKPIHPDYAALRRYLVDYRFLDRVVDGSAYWRIDQ